MSKSELKRLAIQKGECYPTCDFEHAMMPRMAIWLCPNCKRDFSILEYLFWAKEVHPEWFEEREKPNEDNTDA